MFDNVFIFDIFLRLKGFCERSNFSLFNLGVILRSFKLLGVILSIGVIVGLFGLFLL